MGRERCCVVGLVLEINQNIRILRVDGDHPPNDAPYCVGQIWEMDWVPSDRLTPPHIEDVLLLRERLIGQVTDLTGCLTERIRPWVGSPRILFEGRLRFTGNGSGYISRRTGILSESVGFWRPDRTLVCQENDYRVYYYYGTIGLADWQGNPLSVRLRYVGVAPSIEKLPAGTLVRVSLARWWRSMWDGEERCYLQLSGWYC